MASVEIRTERIAYQIWWKIQQTSGECTLADLSRFTGASVASCRSIAHWKGWGTSYRRMARSHATSAGSNLFAEADGYIGGMQ